MVDQQWTEDNIITTSRIDWTLVSPPSDPAFTFVLDGQDIFALYRDRIELKADYTIDDAALAFWHCIAVAARHYGLEFIGQDEILDQETDHAGT